MRSIHPFRPLLVALTVAMSLAACKTNAPGVTNTLGTYKRTFQAQPDAVATAAATALSALDLRHIRDQSTAVDGEVVGYTASNDEVSVRIKAVGSAASEVKVRVGTLGDEGLSLRVLQEIESRL